MTGATKSGHSDRNGRLCRVPGVGPFQSVVRSLGSQRPLPRTAEHLLRADAALQESGGQFSLTRLEHHAHALIKGNARMVRMA